MTRGRPSPHLRRPSPRLGLHAPPQAGTVGSSVSRVVVDKAATENRIQGLLGASPTYLARLPNRTPHAARPSPTPTHKNELTTDIWRCGYVETRFGRIRPGYRTSQEPLVVWRRALCFSGSQKRPLKTHPHRSSWCQLHGPEFPILG